MEINKHNQDANKLSQLLFDETFKKSNNPQKPYTTYTGDSTETFTPRETAEKMVEMLDDLDKKSREVNGQIDEQKPGAIWNDKTTFLDPSCKTGVFLKVIFDKLDTALQNEEVYGDRYKDVTTRRNHILDNQLFGLTLDNEQSLIASRRNVSGRWDYKNIQYITGTVNKDKRFYKSYVHYRYYEQLKEELRKRFNRDMFDVVIGNPPYQDTKVSDDGHSSIVAIYPEFMDVSQELSNRYTQMIIPSRWMSDKPNGLEQPQLYKLRTRDDFRYMTDYSDCKDCFDGVNIAGGVCYYLADKQWHGDCEITYITKETDEKDKTKLHTIEIHRTGRLSDSQGNIIRDLRVGNIVDKVEQRDGKDYRENKTFTSLIGTNRLFSPNDNYFATNWIGFKSSQDSEHTLKYFANSRVLTIVGIDVKDRDYGWVSWDDMPDRDEARQVAKMQKLILPLSGPTDGRVIALPVIGGTDSVCSRTYAPMYSAEIIKTENDCINIIKYMKTKFLRSLVNGVKNTQRATRNVYRLVPLQDFTSNSDINWDKPVSEIDHQLYKKYNLSDDEINYIEKTIKPMV